MPERRLDRTFTVTGDLINCPVVALSVLPVGKVHQGTIHSNQVDRNSAGVI